VSNPIHVLLLLGWIAFWVVPSVMVGRLAARRGRSQAVYLVASLLIGWFLPLIAVLVFSRRRDQAA
jgi:hypothetical protein